MDSAVVVVGGRTGQLRRRCDHVAAEADSSRRAEADHRLVLRVHGRRRRVLVPRLSAGRHRRTAGDRRRQVHTVQPTTSFVFCSR